MMQAWGIGYKTTITWVKDRIGLGQYFRGLTEHCRFDVKGSLPYKVVGGVRQQGRTAIVAPKTRHSDKPEGMRQMIERVSYGPYLELCARERTPGWDVWGTRSTATSTWQPEGGAKHHAWVHVSSIQRIDDVYPPDTLDAQERTTPSVQMSLAGWRRMLTRRSGW